ncbi:Succinyl-CoA:3-ketoacid coenzyme A transferase 1, mitochondrial [Neolecta irregularis DAH-3]|uniref:Succinyl-CoA:3-ketoacid-coenzyme A transferase n=1 Tax=Neolecta irregularis (strain DAH-3) TaxID=1198029 RepID=A0A1U7LJI2_NEOID|nr:Succinyl-CoA:3-ketoacid coenzyme A transferase 1, mitochondrial [Neolecta irregularis DAH-3]|eukprot:OLL22815.1 Succinyl-CoA:3-ketoacid coenzyme A transferase 1, mitochondrial [Neolecta irregularis DAH-3]
MPIIHTLRILSFRGNKTVLRLSPLFTRNFSGSHWNRENVQLCSSAHEAIKDIPSNSILLCGGFGLCGVPGTLINALKERPEVTGLTAVSNNAGIDDVGLGILLKTGQVNKMIASYVGENKTFEKLYLSGELELELTPQGTLAERCRAGGVGIPAFYTPAGVGTVVQTGDLPVRFNKDGSVAVKSQPKEERIFNGRRYIMEEAIKGDFAFIKAYKADKFGNCVFRYAANNFNGAMGRNAKVTIVEAEHIVEPGEIEPTAIHLPGIYVSRLVQSTAAKTFEKYTFAKDPAEMLDAGSGEATAKRERIVKRAAKEFKDGVHFCDSSLSLMLRCMQILEKIGMPMMAPSFLPPSVKVTLQSENGILGLGPYPQKGQEDADLINAGKETVTLKPGSSTFGSEESFGMIRAGKIDLTILGAMQVSQYGDLANFMLPGKIKGMGGAMDLVANPQQTKVVITMEHVDRMGGPKILEECSFPLTGPRCVSRIITDLCVFDVHSNKGLHLIEIAKGITVEEIKEKTSAPFTIAHKLEIMG